MNNRIQKFATSVAALAVCLCMPISAGSGMTDATVQSYEEQLASISAKQQQALNELAEIRQGQSEAWMELAKYDEMLKFNNEMKSLTEGYLDSLVEDIAKNKKLIEDTEKSLENQEQAFLERMKAVYMENDADYLELILGSENLVDFLTKMEYVNAIFDYDSKIISDLETNRKILEDAKASLLIEEQTQLERVADYERAIAEAEQIYDSKLQYISDLQSDESKLVNQYSYYKELENQKNAELEEYLAELQRKSQSIYVGGSINFPLAAGTNYYVSSEYGWRSLYGVQDFHLGIDLACASGTTVCAANSGTVITSESHPSYGNYVVIDHGGGITTLYAHMSSNAVYAGDYVEAGQTVGWVGLTGNTSGFHLHFETRENGKTVDPRNYYTF